VGGNRTGWEEGDGWGQTPTERVRDESSHCRSCGLWDQQQCVVRGWQLPTHAAVRRGQFCTGCHRSTLATPLLNNRFKTDNGRRMKSLKPIRPGQPIGHPYSEDARDALVTLWSCENGFVVSQVQGIFANALSVMIKAKISLSLGNFIPPHSVARVVRFRRDHQ